MSYQREVEMIALAHELDLLTTPCVFSEDDARALARAGADVLSRTWASPRRLDWGEDREIAGRLRRRDSADS